MLVSILIPIYNVGEYISRCISSAINQSYKNLEIIIINDGSTDDSLNICNSFAIKDKRIRIINKINEGLSSARIEGIKNASGDFIFHLDGDDSIPTHTIEVLVKEQKKGNYDLVFGDYFCSNDSSKIFRPVPLTKEDFLFKLLSDCNFIHYIWGILIRKSLYISNNIQPQKGANMGEDLQVLPQLIYYSKSFFKVNVPVYIYNNENASSMTYRKSITHLLEELETYEVLKSFLNRTEQISYLKNLLITEKTYFTKWLYEFTERNESSSYKIIYNKINSGDLKKVKSNNSLPIKMFQKIKYYPIAKIYSLIITKIIYLIEKYHIKYDPHSLKFSFS